MSEEDSRQESRGTSDEVDATRGGKGKTGCRETRQRDDGRVQRETSLGLSLSFFFSPLLLVFQSGWWAERRHTLCKSRTAAHHVNSAICMSLQQEPRLLFEYCSLSHQTLSDEEDVCLFLFAVPLRTRHGFLQVLH